jgi:peptidoglycan hydrolase-like protein with peptidoglycan-binding domain
MPDLKRGSTGSDVKKMQVMLGVEPANGNFGPITETALKDWQTKNGLAATGIATTKELVVMYQQDSIAAALAVADDLGLDLSDSPIGKTGSYEDYINSLMTDTFVESPANQSKVLSNDNTQALTAQPDQEVLSAVDIDSLINSYRLSNQSPAQSASLEASTAQQTSQNIMNTQNILNTANTTTQNVDQKINQTTVSTENAISNVQADQSRVIQNANNLKTVLAGESLTAIQNNTETLNQINSSMTKSAENNQFQTAQTSAENNQFQTAQTNIENVNDVSRVESSQLITKSETSQIINPANPVVNELRGVGTVFEQGLQTLNSDLSTNISNMKSGDTVSNSQVTQVDQSSIYNTAGNKPAPAQVELNQDKAAEPTNSTNLNEVYLAAIYEALIGGIKVKLS